MVVDDVVINKSTAIGRCIARVKVLAGPPEQLALIEQTNFEAIILNLQRACENSIALAVHLTRVKKLGVPQTSRDAFEIIAEAGCISSELLSRLKAMVGFRNVAIHEYQKINPEIVKSIIQKHLGDFEDLVAAVKRA